MTMIEELARQGRCLDESMAMWPKVKEIVPTGTQCLSKGPHMYPFGTSPIFVTRGEGCRVWDVDGNEYIDYGSGLYSISLGYGHPQHARAVCEQVMQGCNFTLPHVLEYKLAERLVEVIPCAEMVRYGKNGSDVTTAAVRLARAITGRDVVIRSGYHGWHDWYVILSERPKGVPRINRELTERFDYNDLDGFRSAMEKHKGNVACVITEGIQTGEVEPGFLETIEKETHEAGALLIFDEIVNGFRLALGGAHEFKNIDVDLATFGKSMANGSPISVLCGKKEVMDEMNEVFFSFTFGGEAPSLAGAMAVLDVYQREDVVGHLWAVGAQLNNGLRESIHCQGLDNVVVVKGYPARTVVTCNDSQGKDDLLLRSILTEQMIKRGFLYCGWHFLNYSHTPEIIDRTIEAFDESAAYLKRAVDSGHPEDFLKGDPINPVFKRH